MHPHHPTHGHAPRRARPLFAACLALLGAFARSQEAPAAPPRQPAAAGDATANPRPFLWRIDGKAPSYLFGTFHLPDERVTAVHPEVERALRDSDAVFTEIPMDMSMSAKLMQAMQMPKGKSLRDVLSADLLQRTRKRIGSDAEKAGLRPWVLSMQALVGTRRPTGEPLDLQVYRDAKSAGKEVGGIETVDEQLAVFESLGLEGEAELLKATLDHVADYEARGRDLCEEMIVAYCSGDVARTLAFFTEMDAKCGVWGTLNRTLLVDRNVRMAERIDRLLQATPVRKFTFAVGAAHLIGATNVVDLLRARGYVITRVPMTAANLDEEIETLQRDVARQEARIEWLRARRAELPEAARRKAG